MTELNEIKSVISQLPVQEIHKLAAWLSEYLAIADDIDLESDIRDGRTDRLIQRAKAEIDAHHHHG
jgi:hypothetical protein